jgi:uncharacterized coiled-coil DUF342 family protein
MEWLQKLCDGQGEEISALHGELRSFRAEVERLSHQQLDLLVEYDQQRKEAERLRAENDGLIEMTTKPGGLYEEIERLRAALRQILEDPDAKLLNSHRDDGWEALKQTY